jgi:hypothetical protein
MTTRARWSGRRVLAVGMLAAAAACGPRPEIAIVQATYGGGACGAPAGNVTPALARTCDGKADCTYKVDPSVLGDPKFGCAKTFEVIWRCPGEEKVRRVELPGEAAFGGPAELTCRAE